MIYKLKNIKLTPYYSLSDMQDMMRNINTDGSQQGRLFSFYTKESDECNLVFAIMFNAGGKENLIGRVSIENINWVNQNGELKVFIASEHCKKGYSFEACKQAIEHGFKQLNLKRIYAGTLSNNLGFQKLAGKLGMEKEGERKKAVWKNGEWLDVLEYGLLRGELVVDINKTDKKEQDKT